MTESQLGFTERDFQELEEFRMELGITAESHPLYIILANSHKILENTDDLEGSP